MSKLSDPQISAKCVEISKSLLNTQVGLLNYDLCTSRSIGDAARFAASIRRAGEIGQDTLAGFSAALKIDFRIAKSEILPLFEDLNWIEVKRKGNVIERVEEKIPPAEDILSTLGQLWNKQQPTLVDQATVVGLSELSTNPMSKEALLSELNLDDKQFQIPFDYGQQARYFGSFTSMESGKEIIYTPLYWAGKIEKVLRFLEKQSEASFETLGNLTKSLLKYPGIPRERLSIKKHKLPLIDSGIWHGYFPSVRIKDRQSKEYEYLFAATPQFEIDPKKDIFERARLIVSCIRHGQYHAEVTKILYPGSILRSMRKNEMKPHPYAKIQYALLFIHGMVRFEPARTKYGKAWRVIWIDSPENNLAADIADQLLAGEEVIAKSKEELEARKVLVQGIFNYSSEQRRVKTSKQIAAKEEFDRLMEYIGGVKL